MIKMRTVPLLLLVIFCTLHDSFSARISHPHFRRRVLHNPFPPSPAPSSSISAPTPPQPQRQKPKLPSSNVQPNGSDLPFFPSGSSLPPPPPPSTPTAIPSTFPANISSLVLPQAPSSRKRSSTRLVAVAAAVFSVTLVFVLALIFYCRRRCTAAAADKTPRSDSLQRYRANAATTDSHGGGSKPPRRGPSGTSSDFLYLGTLVNSRIGDDYRENTPDSAAAVSPISMFQKLGSPELRPLPQLPRQNFQRDDPNAQDDNSSIQDEDEEEFYSPRGSRSSKERAFQGVDAENVGSQRILNSQSTSCPSSKSPSPTHSTCNNTTSPTLNSSPRSSISRSPKRNSDISDHQSANQSGQRFPRKVAPPQPPPAPPPPPPPLPRPSGYWETHIAPITTHQPSIIVTPDRPVVIQNGAQQVSPSGKPLSPSSLEKSDDTPKPKLKPLHWDKVRASSDRAMVWDQLKSSSFKLNEEMIENLFMVSGSDPSHRKNSGQAFLRMHHQENQVLDPKKSQNIAILLRALNVTIDEVCESLLEGNADALGPELLESMLKMAPTKEEERGLKEFKDESPSKLGPAERFLKAVIDIPFAFKRVHVMLYIANFDSEVGYLKRCFETLEAACGELRNSRMFLKLLEAVLKTGNRMNVGTNRGDARAFKLDTLLKLVDVKGADGKTTLLHFVVQEIIRVEGSRLSAANQNCVGHTGNEAEIRKLGLQVVSGLCNELTNVKKAAAMDSDVLCNDVGKLAQGIAEARNVVKLIEQHESKDGSGKFCGSMNGFLQGAEEEINRIQAQQSVAHSSTRELTMYFHGDSVKVEAHPFRIFMVVGDFLSCLDRVCKEVGKINEERRAGVSVGREFPQPTHQSMLPPFPGFNGSHEFRSSDDESSSSSTSL